MHASHVGRVAALAQVVAVLSGDNPGHPKVGQVHREVEK